MLLPLAWVGFEYLRGTIGTGFPWNALGVSQWRNLPMIQAASWGGVYAVSALIVFVNVLFATTIIRFLDSLLHDLPRPKLRLEMLLAVTCCALYWLHGHRELKALEAGTADLKTVRVAAVQPNIPQLKKWEPEFPRYICDQLSRQTELAAAIRPDLVVWPETAVPGPVNSDPAVAEFVRGEAKKVGCLLVGSLEEQPAPGGDEPLLYNSSFLFDGEGRVVDVYRKLHLVPFGEYLPLDDKVALIRQLGPLGYSCSAGTRMTVFHLEPSGVTFSALICFEDIFGGLSRLAVKSGAGFLVNQTNDGWFDGSAGAMQHLSQAVFRCVENRVSMVRCANTGVTGFIDRCGRSSLLIGSDGQARCAGMKPGAVEVRPAGAPLTFYTRWGDLPFALPCGVVAGAVFLLVMIPGNRKMSTHEIEEKQDP